MQGSVLIVDDDLGNRGFLRECLEREGYRVTTLEGGSQVKQVLDGTRFDVIILSVDTPGVRERDLLVTLGKHHRPRILLIVSERGDIFLRDAIDLGVYGFIYKPFDPREICTMITHLVR